MEQENKNKETEHPYPVVTEGFVYTKPTLDKPNLPTTIIPATPSKDKERIFTLSFDFDGVIHAYSDGWKDGSIYDSPVEGALEFIVLALYKYHWNVFIMSTRDPVQIKDWFDLQKTTPKIASEVIEESTFVWNKKGVLGITNRKLMASIYIDDRGLRFDGNFSNLDEKLQLLRTWQDRE